MKRFSTFTAIVAIATIISACGAPATPTANPADIAGTAQAAAFTMIAQTQAAIPTNTLPPPTEIPTQTPLPLPTDTPLSLPTVSILASPTTASSTSNTGTDPCATRVIGKPLGKKTIIRIWNNTKTPITVSLYLNKTKDHDECGYRSYSLAKGGDVVISDLVFGCYNLWAWNTSGKPNFNSSGEGCINNSDKWTFIVTPALIKFAGP